MKPMSGVGLPAPSKKSRAKSCAACRQVKLKCDARERYPESCSRCRARKLECRMDSNFKRVTKRSLAPLAESRRESCSVDSVDSMEPPTQLLGPDKTQIASRPKADLAQKEWLCVDTALEREVQRSWRLGNVEVSSDVLLDLYKQFEDHYYVHLPILEPVRFLQRLCEDSIALFWVIALTTSRHHPQHLHLYEKLLEPVRLLILNLLSSPVQGLKNLQALVIICQWPFKVDSQSEDSSFMHVGFVVNAALHMGLDKFEDEVLFGHRRAKNSLGHYDARYRRRTWLKIFQISTELSTWHGLRPQLAFASSLQGLSNFCDVENKRELIALTEIQRQIAQSTIGLADISSHGPQVSLAEFFTQKLDAIQKRYADVWSPATEICLHGAKLYCYTHCLLLSDLQDAGAQKHADVDNFVTTVLQQGHNAALILIRVIRSQGLASTIDPLCSRIEQGGSPLLAHPKQHWRLAFYAALFLLKYIDCHPITSGPDHDAARFGISTVYQVFKQLQSRGEAVRAAQTLEVLGRSVMPGKRRIKTWVKTRMGASLNYNAVWAAAKLRGRQHDPEYTPSTSSVSGEVVDTFQANDAISGAESAVIADELLSSSVPGADMLEQAFPWGVWDDAAYDELRFEIDDQSFLGGSGGMHGF